MDAFSFVILAVAVWILMELAYRLGRLLRNNTDPAPGTDPTPQQISDLHAQDRFLVRPVALKPYINELAQILDQIRENGDVQIFPASFLAALFRPVGELWRCLHEISQISPMVNKYEIRYGVRGLPPLWDGKQNTHLRARGIDRQSCGTAGQSCNATPPKLHHNPMILRPYTKAVASHSHSTGAPCADG